mmetsp:Transcript_6257/g.17670  ORF Transcript_6257/g.17670 Transcript_6257/m.17670 type:complete len:233 (-) Transcript_6257:214-912(-)
MCRRSARVTAAPSQLIHGAGASLRSCHRAVLPNCFRPQATRQARRVPTDVGTIRCHHLARVMRDRNSRCEALSNASLLNRERVNGGRDQGRSCGPRLGRRQSVPQLKVAIQVCSAESPRRDLLWQHKPADGCPLSIACQPANGTIARTWKKQRGDAVAINGSRRSRETVECVMIDIRRGAAQHSSGKVHLHTELQRFSDPVFQDQRRHENAGANLHTSVSRIPRRFQHLCGS